MVEVVEVVEETGNHDEVDMFLLVLVEEGDQVDDLYL